MESVKTPSLYPHCLPSTSMLDFHFESPFAIVYQTPMCHDKSIGQLSVIGGWTDKQQVTCCYCCWVKKTALPLLSTQPHDTFLERRYHKIQSETSKANLINSRTATTGNLLPSSFLIRSGQIATSSFFLSLLHFSRKQTDRPTDGGGSEKRKNKQESAESHLS